MMWSCPIYLYSGITSHVPNNRPAGQYRMLVLEMNSSNLTQLQKTDVRTAMRCITSDLCVVSLTWMSQSRAPCCKPDPVQSNSFLSAVDLELVNIQYPSSTFIFPFCSTPSTEDLFKPPKMSFWISFRWKAFQRIDKTTPGKTPYINQHRLLTLERALDVQINAEASDGSSTFGSNWPLFCIFFTCGAKTLSYFTVKRWKKKVENACFIRFFLCVLKPNSFL